jgi:L-aspartate oxidase
MGGVETDVWGRTSLPGLFAAGEVACTGVHGANRLASNSLLEGLVFGARAGMAMQKKGTGVDFKGFATAAPQSKTGAMEGENGGSKYSRPLSTDEVRDLMWRAVGLFRTREGLQEAVLRLGVPGEGRLTSGGNADAWRQRHLATVGGLMARAALRREESRGGHFRADFPHRDDRNWKVHVVDQRGIA